MGRTGAFEVWVPIAPRSVSLQPPTSSAPGAWTTTASRSATRSADNDCTNESVHNKRQAIAVVVVVVVVAVVVVVVVVVAVVVVSSSSSSHDKEQRG